MNNDAIDITSRNEVIDQIKRDGNQPLGTVHKVNPTTSTYNGIKLLSYEDGRIKENKIQNIVNILSYDRLLKGAFRYNDFTEHIEVSRDIPELHIQAGNIKDDYYSQLIYYIETNYGNATFKDDLLNRGISVVARNNSYNPLRDYMNQAGIDWDGKPRLDKILPDYLGANTNEYTSKVTRLWFVGGVARVFNPRMKFDYVLDLVGGQGIGKTTFLQRIAPLGYYTDQFNSFTDKDDLIAISDAFIINDDEMSASNKMSFRDLKKFISANKIEYRPPYARFSQKKLKKVIIARTTNEKHYLKDLTGTRRFMPVMTSKDQQIKSPYRDLTTEVVEQIWGEAVHIYQENLEAIKNKKYFVLSEDEEALFKLESEHFRDIDSIEGIIDDAMYGKWQDKDFISYDEVRYVLSISTAQRKEFKQAKRVLLSKYGLIECKNNGKRGVKQPSKKS